MNREAARDAKRDFFVGFVLILEERFRIITHQALTGEGRRGRGATGQAALQKAGQRRWET